MSQLKNITDLRETLFDTIEKIKTGEIDANKGKAICSIGQVIVNSAKVESDFIIKVNATADSGFLMNNQKKIS